MTETNRSVLDAPPCTCIVQGPQTAEYKGPPYTVNIGYIDNSPISTYRAGPNFSAYVLYRENNSYIDIVYIDIRLYRHDWPVPKRNLSLINFLYIDTRRFVTKRDIFWTKSTQKAKQ